jgi:hypothetical protein
VGSFFAKCEGGEAAGSRFFLLLRRRSAVRAGFAGLLTASLSKPFLVQVFGRASASAGGEAEAEALPKGA